MIMGASIMNLNKLVKFECRLSKTYFLSQYIGSIHNGHDDLDDEHVS